MTDQQRLNSTRRKFDKRPKAAIFFYVTGSKVRKILPRSSAALSTRYESASATPVSYEFKVVNIAISPAEGRANFEILDSKTVKTTYWKVLLPLTPLSNEYAMPVYFSQDRKYCNERAQMFEISCSKLRKINFLRILREGKLSTFFTPPRYKYTSLSSCLDTS